MTRTAAGVRIVVGPVFFLSGCSALIYQVAWQRLLTLHYGVGPVSIALIVSVFMLGLGLGGLVGGRVAERVSHPARAYWVIELILGGFGAASLPWLDRLGQATATSSYPVAALVCAGFLLVPTLLMGATLPILLKLDRGYRADYLESLSLLYFVNTLGAAIGSLVAAYGLISFVGLDGAVWTAAGLNVLLAGVVALVTRRLPPPLRRVSTTPTLAELPGGLAMALVFVTGFLAIGYEILWFLNLQQITKASPYSFATILFVYLLGIALGSLAMNRAATRIAPADRRAVFFVIQVAIAAYVAVTVIGYRFALQHTPLGPLAVLTDSFEVHPPPINFEAGLRHFWNTWGSPKGIYQLTDTLFWPLLYILVPACLMGASFPLVASLAYGDDRPREAQATGTLYFWNVMGNVLGAAATGFVLLPVLGSEATFMAFCLVGICFALGAGRLFGRRVPLALRGALGAALGLWMIVEFPRHGAFLYVPATAASEADGNFFDEGVSGIVYSHRGPRSFGLAINGLGHGGRDGVGPLEGRAGFYIEAYGALRVAPALDHVLVIGFGTGSTSEAVLTMPDLRRLTIVEINETLLKNLSRQPFFQKIREDPRVEWVVDDARRLLNRDPTRYDAVLMDPLRETTIYSNNIYSRQFFDLVKRHLTDGGVLMAWLQTEEQLNTLAAVFPHARLECSLYGLGSERPLTIRRDVEPVVRRVFPAKSLEALDARRRLCPDTDRALAYRKTIPLLDDRTPMLEYHLGRYHHALRARRGAQP